MAAPWRQNLIVIRTDPPTRLWTGRGELTLDGESYAGAGRALRVSEAETASGEPDRRLRIVLGVIPAAARAEFLQDLGPLETTVEWIYSTDRGASWNKLPLSYRGRLSSPAMRNGALELETQRGDVDRGKPLRWSHEDQQRRHADDEGLEHMRALARQGVGTTWPP